MDDFLLIAALYETQYLQLLEEAVKPTITADLINDGVNYEAVFQQDGASPHIYLPIRQYSEKQNF